MARYSSSSASPSSGPFGDPFSRAGPQIGRSVFSDQKLEEDEAEASLFRQGLSYQGQVAGAKAAAKARERVQKAASRSSSSSGGGFLGAATAGLGAVASVGGAIAAI